MTTHAMHSGQFCAVCREELTEDFELYRTHSVLGEDVKLCLAHGKAWRELGPMATLVAYALRKMGTWDK